MLSIALAVIISATAQNANDTVTSENLQEVVVKASRKIQKGDTLSVIPSDNQRKFCSTGFELLRSMMLPGLRVNAITGELSLSDGGSALVLIDGRPVDRQDVLALRPKEIARVEYIQDPGPEYGYDQSLGAVINVIMKERTDGYAAAVVANNAVTTANGQNFIFGKYTKNNSEFGISFDSDYASLTKRRIDDNTTYLIGDQPYNILYKGMDTPLKYTSNTLQANYNLYIPGKHIFDVTFTGGFYYSPDRGYAQKVTENGKSPYYQLTEPYEKNLYPKLNIYYKYYFSKNSSLAANLVGIYRNTDYHYDMKESPDYGFDNPTYTYRYGTRSKRQSYIGEVKYVNRFNRKITLSVGSRISHAYTSNTYIGDNPSLDKQYDTRIYAYTAASGYLGKLSYSAGIGIDGTIIKQNGESMHKWMPRPMLRFTYKIKKWSFNLGGTLTQCTPSLSEMASTEFRINRFEIKRGNPDLKNWWKYRLSLRTTGKIGPVNIQNTLSYTNAHNPVMSFVDRMQTSESALFITSFGNQKRMSVLTDNLNLEYIISDNLSVSAGVGYDNYQSRGSDYSHNLSKWRFNIAAEWFQGNWNIGVNWWNREYSLSGETVSLTGARNAIYVNYIIGNQWRIGLMGQYLFCKNGPVFETRELNRYMIKNETVVVPAQRNMIMITLAWNFSKGKQRKEAKIDMTNEDNESGIFK